MNEKPWGMEQNTYCMLLHLSQFAGFAFPGLGLAMPIVMWATNKDSFPEIDRHGKVVFNWIISSIIYYIICVILMLVVIGFVLIFVVAILSFVFTIIGAIKANEGKVWRYPLSIPFFKVD